MFHRETAWHNEPAIDRLWDKEELTGEEAAHEQMWAHRPCTPLRSAILTRAMSLWYKSDIYPD